MELIEQKIRTLNNGDFPGEVHQSIMRKVNYLKLRPLLLVMLLVCSVNILVLASHITTSLVEGEFLNMVRDFTNGPYVGFFVAGIALEKFIELISIEILASLFLNMAGAFYVSNKLRIYRAAK